MQTQDVMDTKLCHQDPPSHYQKYPEITPYTLHHVARFNTNVSPQFIGKIEP